MLPTKLSLVLLMMVAVNFSLANPVKNNVEEHYDMNNAMEGNYKFTRSAEFIDEEDSKKASWETSRYFFNGIAPFRSLMILKKGESESQVLAPIKLSPHHPYPNIKQKSFQAKN